uniref:Uncharacterized protein n=1 Tax=Oryza glumipatula TaxID=40148 RepID=A0A0D9ZTS6_9ORYZ
MKDEEMVTMLLHDGCFIIKHLYNFVLGYNEEELYATRWAPAQLRIDLGMLENQIPFFVLEEIFYHLTPQTFQRKITRRVADRDDDKTMMRQSKRHKLIVMAMWYMLNGWFVLPEYESHKLYRDIAEEEVHHLLHLLHKAHVVRVDSAAHLAMPTWWKLLLCVFNWPLWFLMSLLLCLCMCYRRFVYSDVEPNPMEETASAAQLRALGVNIRRVQRERGGILDVRFHKYQNAILEIPQLFVNQATMPLLQNLVAYEQLSTRSSPSSLWWLAEVRGPEDYFTKDYFTMYAFLMSNLVRTTEDITVLQAHGVLFNNLGSHQSMIDYFQNLCHLWPIERSNRVTPIGKELRLRQLAPPVDPEIAAVRTCAAAACRHPQQQLPHLQPQREDRVGGAAERPRRQDQDGASGARRDPRRQAKGGTASLSRCPYMPPLFLFVDHATAPLAAAQPRRVREQQGTAPPRPETRNELPEDYFTTYAFLMYNLVFGTGGLALPGGGSPVAISKQDIGPVYKTNRVDFNRRWAPAQLRIDLGMLENQIPFFVLEEIFYHLTPRKLQRKITRDVDVVGMTMRQSKRQMLLVMATWYMLNGWFDLSEDEIKLYEVIAKEEVHHLLHLLHLAHVVKVDEAPKSPPCEWQLCWQWPWHALQLLLCILPLFLVSLPLHMYRCCGGGGGGEEPDHKANIASASQLRGLGVKISKAPTKRGGILDVRLRNDLLSLVLEVPALTVDQGTVQLLQNLVAYEQQGTPPPSNDDEHPRDYFTTYAFLMYNLVSSTDDIAVLQEQGVLLNNFGSHETIIEYFKNLCRGNQRSGTKVKTDIGKVLQGLRDCSQYQLYRDWAEAKKYMDSPVKILALVVSTLLAISTILQTTTAFYPK